MKKISTFLKLLYIAHLYISRKYFIDTKRSGEIMTKNTGHLIVLLINEMASIFFFFFFFFFLFKWLQRFEIIGR